MVSRSCRQLKVDSLKKNWARFKIWNKLVKVKLQWSTIVSIVLENELMETVNDFKKVKKIQHVRFSNTIMKVIKEF
jgi:hypothetical protein